MFQKRGIDEFVLIGLCSGADEAHSVAVLDSRVSGVIFLDAYGYGTLGFYVRHYGPRLFKLTPWKTFLKRKYSYVLSKAHKGVYKSQTEEAIYERQFPPKKEIMADLIKLVERRVNLLYIYTGSLRETYYNYRGQFKDMFRAVDFKGKVQLEYFDEADHIYTSLSARGKLIRTVCDWMLHHYTYNEESNVPPTFNRNL